MAMVLYNSMINTPAKLKKKKNKRTKTKNKQTDKNMEYLPHVRKLTQHRIFWRYKSAVKFKL